MPSMPCSRVPPSCAQFPERDDGILRGHSEIEKLFARNFVNLKAEFSELYRSGLFFSNGRLLSWEYPRLTPQRQHAGRPVQIDGHRGRPDRLSSRLTWGWQGLKTLLAVRKS